MRVPSTNCLYELEILNSFGWQVRWNALLLFYDESSSSTYWAAKVSSRKSQSARKLFDRHRKAFVWFSRRLSDTRLALLVAVEDAAWSDRLFG